MKIIFVSPLLYPCNTGGAEIFNYYYIQEIQKKHQVQVITLCTDFPGRIRRIYKIKPIKVFVALQIFFHILATKNIDVVHLSFMGKSSRRWFIYPLLKKLFNIKYMVTIHGGGLYEWKPFWPLKAFFKYAEIITAVSERAQREYEKRTGKDVILTPPLIPFTKSSEKPEVLKSEFKIPLNSKVLLYVGSIREQKGTDILIEGFFKLGIDFLKNHNLYLVLAGDGDIKNKLQKYVFNSAIRDNIIFIGKIKHEEINKLYKLSDFYIISSQFENTPLSLLEAMFNGKVIIGSDAPGINNIITHGVNGLLYQKGDPIDFTKNIIYLINHPDLHENFKIKAQEFYEVNYNYRILIEDFLQLIENVQK